MELQDRVLVVSGKHRPQPEAAPAGVAGAAVQAEGQPDAPPCRVWRRERHFRKFMRSFSLPDNAKPEEITASMVSPPRCMEVAGWA